jgi:hypothetical protein
MRVKGIDFVSVPTMIELDFRAVQVFLVFPFLLTPSPCHMAVLLPLYLYVYMSYMLGPINIY